MKFGALAVVVALALTACGSTSNNTGSTQKPPPTETLKPLDKVGAGEGQLNLIAWEGYVDDSWAKPFTQQTGCVISSKYAGSSDEMVSLMKNGGGGQYDKGSAPGDADLRLIYSGGGKPVKEKLIPDRDKLQTLFKKPPHKTHKPED